MQNRNQNWCNKILIRTAIELQFWPWYRATSCDPLPPENVWYRMAASHRKCFALALVGKSILEADSNEVLGVIVEYSMINCCYPLKVVRLQFHLESLAGSKTVNHKTLGTHMCLARLWTSNIHATIIGKCMSASRKCWCSWLWMPVHISCADAVHEKKNWHA